MHFNFTDHWHWPQWVFLFIILYSLIKGMSKHDRFKSLFNVAVITFVVIAGGFFS